jgi:hypothetical protein
MPASAKRSVYLMETYLGRFKWSSQRLTRSYDDQIEAASLRSFW